VQRDLPDVGFARLDVRAQQPVVLDRASADHRAENLPRARRRSFVPVPLREIESADDPDALGDIATTRQHFWIAGGLEACGLEGSRQTR
jgi:hypothetical protein